MDAKTALRDSLRALRMGKRLTQEKVAEESGLATRAYQHYERGEQEPTLSKLLALADFYDISLDELVGRKRRRTEAGDL